jgi:hypothetical protein
VRSRGWGDRVVLSKRGNFFINCEMAEEGFNLWDTYLLWDGACYETKYDESAEYRIIR